MLCPAIPVTYFSGSELVRCRCEVGEEMDRLGRLGRSPKAVVAVDLFGQSADYEPIASACARWGVPPIKDAAEALGVIYSGPSRGQLRRDLDSDLQWQQAHRH